MDVKTSDVFCEEFREQYRKDGYTEQEIDQIQRDTIYFRKIYLQKTEEREITSHSFEISKSKTKKQVEIFLGGPK